MGGDSPPGKMGSYIFYIPTIYTMGLYAFILDHIKISIDRNFIKEFYEMQMNPGYYKIELNTVVKWLSVNKREFITTLKRTYRKDDDYIVIEKDLKKRLQKLNTTTGDDLKLVYFTECEEIVMIEKCMKFGLRKYRYRPESPTKEYFKCNSLTIIKKINLCKDFYEKTMSRSYFDIKPKSFEKVIMFVFDD
jgi:hypothetical protein